MLKFEVAIPTHQGNRCRKVVPCAVRSIERLMKRHAEGQTIIDTEWLHAVGGQNRAVPNYVVAQTAARILEQVRDKGNRSTRSC